MDDLIKVSYESDRPTVSARGLHDFLEPETPFRIWFPRMVKYGFGKGIDFNPYKNVRVQNEGGRQVSREVTDYQLTIDMAKELCMIQRSEKGKQARQYFLDVEKKWNSPEFVMARAVRMADEKLKLSDKKIKTLESKVEEDKPKVLFADSVAGSRQAILIREMAKLLKQNGVDMGEKRLFSWLRANGFLISCGDDYNLPTQKSMNLGLMIIRERTYTDDVHTRIMRTPMITGKGQQYFIRKFLTKKSA